MSRRELMDNLLAEDPDVVVDVLGLTTQELVKAFPVHVNRYIQLEMGEARYGEELNEDNEDDDQ